MNADQIRGRIRFGTEGSQYYIEVDGKFAGGWDVNEPNEDLAYYCDAEECEWLVLNGEGDTDVVNGWHEFLSCECGDFSRCQMNIRNVEEYFPEPLDDMVEYIVDEHILDDVEPEIGTDALIEIVNGFYGRGDFDDYWDYYPSQR